MPTPHRPVVEDLPEVPISYQSSHARIDYLPSVPLPREGRTIRVKLSNPWMMVFFEPVHLREAIDSDRHKKVFFSNRTHFCPGGTDLSHQLLDSRQPELLALHMDQTFVRSTLDSLVPNGGLRETALVRNASPTLLTLSKLLRARMLKGDNLTQMQLDSFLVLFLAEWVPDLVAQPQQSQARQALSGDLLEKVDAFMMDNLDREIGLTDLAAQAGLSPAYFLRAFKAATGQTPFRYLMERRVNRAGALLRDSKKTLAEISLICGFASQSHMSDAFKRHMNTTPGRYRRSGSSLQT